MGCTARKGKGGMQHTSVLKFNQGESMFLHVGWQGKQVLCLEGPHGASIMYQKLSSLQITTLGTLEK